MIAFWLLGLFALGLGLVWWSARNAPVMDDDGVEVGPESDGAVK